MKVLVSCPPMLGLIDEFRPLFEAKNVELIIPNLVQTLTEEELEELLPEVDGWIIGDDPASSRVLTQGRKGKLKAVVKWGVGTDNVDFDACDQLNLPVSNTPNMFGKEVANMAVAYLIGLARETFYVDRGVRNHQWPKPPGISLYGKTVNILGFGDIGNSLAKVLFAMGLKVNIYDPFIRPSEEEQSRYNFYTWPEKIEQADFVVSTCSLTPQTKYLINSESIALMKDGVRIINVSRGPIINEEDLIMALSENKVHSAAMDVFEIEPLPNDSKLRSFDRCIFGTHNGSNTKDAVIRTSHLAITKLFDFLNI